MNTAPIATYLSSIGHGTIGVDLFADHMPEHVVRGILVIARTTTQIDPYIHGLRRGEFRVIVRSDDDAAGAAKANQLVEDLRLLEIKQEITLGNMCFKCLYPVHEPLKYPWSENGVLEFSINFRCTYIIV